MDHLTDCSCDQCLLMHMRAANAAERQRGWEAWYRRDAPTIQAYIERRCLALQCSEHSEDILQDCFLVGFRNVSNGLYREQGTSLCAYLVGIAKNLLRELVRLRRREPVELSEEETEDEWGLDPDDSLHLEEVVNRVREAYPYLPHLYKRVVKGLYVESKSSSKLADELGKSGGNVRAIAHRAVREIGQYLECQHSMHLSTEAIRACLEVL
jgi:RNA polymerase sigma factor (sigma-70 family)